MTDTPPHGFRTFVLVWSTQSLSVIGSGMTSFALDIYLAQSLYPAPQQKAELALALTILNTGFFLIYVFGAPFAGAFVDRHDRKRVMIVSDVASALASLAIIVLIATGTMRLSTLFVVAVLSAVPAAFHYAAYDASSAMLVPERLLPRANGMIQTVGSLSGIVSPALAAGIVALSSAGFSHPARLSSGTPLVLAIDAATFAGSALVLAFLQVPSPHRPDRATGGRIATGLLADIRGGGRYVLDRPPLLWLLVTFTVANLAGAPVGLVTPLIAKFTLAADRSNHGLTFESTLAMLTAAAGLGGVCGGLLVSTWGGLRRRRLYGVLGPMIGAGLTEMVYGLSPFVALSMVAAFCQAGMHPILNAHSQTIWQMRTPREIQGRVFAIRRAIAQGSLPLGMILGGTLAGSFTPGLVLGALGAVLALVCVAQLFNPSLARVEDRSPTPPRLSTR